MQEQDSLPQKYWKMYKIENVNNLPESEDEIESFRVGYRLTVE